MTNTPDGTELGGLSADEKSAAIDCLCAVCVADGAVAADELATLLGSIPWGLDEAARQAAVAASLSRLHRPLDAVERRDTLSGQSLPPVDEAALHAFLDAAAARLPAAAAPREALLRALFGVAASEPELSDPEIAAVAAAAQALGVSPERVRAIAAQLLPSRRNALSAADVAWLGEEQSVALLASLLAVVAGSAPHDPSARRARVLVELKGKLLAVPWSVPADERAALLVRAQDVVRAEMATPEAATAYVKRAAQLVTAPRLREKVFALMCEVVCADRRMETDEMIAIEQFSLAFALPEGRLNAILSAARTYAVTTLSAVDVSNLTEAQRAALGDALCAVGCSDDGLDEEEAAKLWAELAKLPQPAGDEVDTPEACETLERAITADVDRRAGETVVRVGALPAAQRADLLVASARALPSNLRERCVGTLLSLAMSSGRAGAEELRAIKAYARAAGIASDRAAALAEESAVALTAAG